MPDKQQYVSEVEEKMSDWDRRIEAIVRKAEESDKDSVLVKDLLEKQQEAKSRFEQLQSADDAQYEDLKGRVSVATQSLQDVLVRTSEQFQVGNPRPASGSTRAGEEAQAASSGDSHGGGTSRVTPGVPPNRSAQPQGTLGPRTQPGQGQAASFGGVNQERRREGGAAGTMPGSQRP